jgi:predicted aspartyl protease
MRLEYAQKLRDLEREYEFKKHQATGDTVFDRIFNDQDQTIIELVKRISQEALPDGWSCDVKVEEFTHFILLIYLPHNSERPKIDQVTPYLKPIFKYCSWWLSDIAIFDSRHKSYLFFDKSLLTRLKSGNHLSKEIIELSTKQGSSFTRFNSVTVDCEKYESHLFLPVEISGPNGVIGGRALLDTGASVTMLSSEIITATGWDNIQNAPLRTFNTVNGTISCPIVKREVNIGGIRKNIEVAVNQQDALTLVGMNFFAGMDYIVDFSQSAVYMWEK